MLLEIKHAHYCLRIAPEIGGAIAEYSRQTKQGKQHLLRPTSPESLLAGDVLGMASFPLLPFCNRLRNAQFVFENKRIQLRQNTTTMPHALHGVGWQLPWTVSEHSARKIVLELSYIPQNDVRSAAWPWRFYARQEFELQDEGLTTRLFCKSRYVGDAVWLGFSSIFSTSDLEKIACDSQAMWLKDAEDIPQDLVRNHFIDQLREGIRPAEHVLDHHFTAWSHTANLLFQSTSSSSEVESLNIRASDNCQFVLLYTPESADYFCVEPVTQCADSFNRPKNTCEEIGGAVLLPGDSAACWMSIQKN